MFWSKNKNADKQKKQEKELQGNSSGVRQNTSDKSQQLRQEALANARKARAEIGDEALNKIAAMMTKKQQSLIEQTKRKVAETDADRVAQEILLMIELDGK